MRTLREWEYDLRWWLSWRLEGWAVRNYDAARLSPPVYEAWRGR